MTFSRLAYKLPQRSGGANRKGKKRMFTVKPASLYVAIVRELIKY